MRQQVQLKRSCYSCGSLETYLDDGKSPHWYINRDKEDNSLCRKCFDHLIHGPKIHACRVRLVINGIRIQLPFDPRIGVCNWCRGVRGIDCRKTDLHHDNDIYDITNPLWNTIELCSTCHGKETWRLTSNPALLRGEG